MKKNLFYAFALILSMGLFTACSSDDDEKEELTIEQVIDTQLVGTYAGTLDISANGIPLGADIEQSVILSKSSAAKNALKLEVKNLQVATFNLNISVEPCTVVEGTDGIYTFAGSQEVTVEGLGNYPVTVEGAVKGGNISMDIAVTNVNPFGTIDVSFTGNK